MMLNIGSSVMDDKDNLYILDKIIGQGGFGYVFRAHRENDNSVFAVKTTIPSFGDTSSAVAFKNEILSASKVSGKNVIRYEYVHNGDTFSDLPPYIIMEYADSGTLKDLLSRREQKNIVYSNDELVCIFKQLAEGMKQINSHLVHRDIKPENILLCGNTLKISDFGLSKVATESTRTMTFKGGGTPLYMAPEAWNLNKNTIQMDIYSMGIIFYQLATLRYPYTPFPRTYEECRDMHLYTAIANPAKINSDLSPSLSSLIIRMLEKSVKRRFSTWDEILELLDVPTTVDSAIDKMVDMAVVAKNEEDSTRQQREAALKQQQKEKEDFLKLIRSQFEQTIIAPISEFVERVNLRYAGKDKLTFSSNTGFAPNQTTFARKLTIPPNNFLTIKLEAILEDNFVREVPVDRIFMSNQTRMEHYTPQYKGKNILAWGEIVNGARYGFNILLLDSGDIYGDWIIMNNKNNLSSMAGRERREPFAFTLQELQKEIDKVQITSLYCSDFKEFTDSQFIESIQQLLFLY